MIPILSMAQMKALDQHTIDHETIKSIDLMERACNAFVAWFTDRFDLSRRVTVVCGTGNNGGDGLGVARMLSEKGFSVEVCLAGGRKGSVDFMTNLKQLHGGVKVTEFENTETSFDGDVVIDALFGSGLSRPLEGKYTQAIDAMNKVAATRVAIDIPSGLMADTPSSGAIFNAHYTVSFQLPKLAFLLPDSYCHTGEWVAIDIGLDKAFMYSRQTKYHVVEKEDVCAKLKLRGRFQHKGDFGKALLISGSYGKMGAAVLGARAAIHSGLGLLTVHAPRCGYSILQTAVPEAMVSIDGDDERICDAPDLSPYDAVGLGPGIGTDPRTVKAMALLLERCELPLVIDADAINILAAHREFIHLLPQGSILTPHPGEFRRLVGDVTHDFDRLERQLAFATSTGTYLLVKGAYTTLATPDGQVIFNTTGNPGMATGGSGDVLTGILTGLLAQGYTSFDAAMVGVYLHGLAGDIAVRTTSQEYLSASDLILGLSEAFGSLREE